MRSVVLALCLLSSVAQAKQKSAPVPVQALAAGYEPVHAAFLADDAKVKLLLLASPG